MVEHAISLSVFMVCTCAVVRRVLPMVFGVLYAFKAPQHKISSGWVSHQTLTEYWQFISTKKTNPWYNMLQVSSQTTSVHYVLKPT
jgi:hypothetical protein